MSKPVSILAAGLAACLCLTACASRPQGAELKNACTILDRKDDWARALTATERRWGTRPELTLAILYQESGFQPDARPPRGERRLFGLLPGKRPSSAFGYAQALDPTWDWYTKETGQRFASRDDFDDAVDFIGWYTAKSQKQLGLSPTDFAEHYLAYHEGHGGYRRGTYRQKAWLMQTAQKVEANALAYRRQIDRCPGALSRGFWPF